MLEVFVCDDCLRRFVYESALTPVKTWRWVSGPYSYGRDNGAWSSATVKLCSECILTIDREPPEKSSR